MPSTEPPEEAILAFALVPSVVLDGSASAAAKAEALVDLEQDVRLRVHRFALTPAVRQGLEAALEGMDVDDVDPGAGLISPSDAHTVFDVRETRVMWAPGPELIVTGRLVPTRPTEHVPVAGAVVACADRALQRWSARCAEGGFSLCAGAGVLRATVSVHPPRKR